MATKKAIILHKICSAARWLYPFAIRLKYVKIHLIRPFAARSGFPPPEVLYQLRQVYFDNRRF